MRNQLGVLTILIAAVSMLVGCSGESAKSAASGVTKKTVEVAKGTITGIDEGIEEGRKAAESSDGAVIVNTGEEFEKALTVELLSIQKHGEQPGCQITLGFGNAGSSPIRATNLSKGNIILLDSKGYVCDNYSGTDEVTIPANAKKKMGFAFKCEPQNAGKVRIFGKDYDIPSELKPAEPTPVESATPKTGGASDNTAP